MIFGSCGIPDICSMLKNVILISLLGAFLVLMVGGCKKKDDVIHSVYSSEDHAICQILFADVVKVMDNIVNDIDELRGDICVDVIEVDTTGLPMLLLIDYGADECMSLDGRFRTGELYAQFTGRYNEEGAQITIIPNGYRIDDYWVNGQISITNLGDNLAGNRERSFVVVGGEIKAPNNAFTLSWECDQVMEFIEGEVSWFAIDDVHAISGTSIGTNRNGVEYETSTKEALRLDAVCRWFRMGSLEVVPSGRQSRELDFGINVDVCNDLATVLVEGKSYTITLP